ncbi:MAG: four helix bundle protein [Patescibacteria group bacterium]
METKKRYILLKDLKVYQLARELSRIGWEMYKDLDWQTKKIMGDQFIEATDSIGANIAEGYSRFHYLDKIKFYYTSRASLSECNDHWLELLLERKKIKDENHKKFKTIAEQLSIKLNNFITTTYNSKNNN